MHIWHDTTDAPRRPRCVSPAQPIEIVVGTWPILPGQTVWVHWQRMPANGEPTEGDAAAEWQRNVGVNSYWSARLGPGADGDRLTYTVHGSSSEGAVSTPAVSLQVRPLYLAWIWHQHQPLYRTPAAPTKPGSCGFPWVRLHAIRDYYSMAALAGEHNVRLTFNLTPVLLDQIDDYVLYGATDTALDLTQRPAERLSRSQIGELLSTFFDADWHNQIYVHPRYRELFERRTAGARFSIQDIRDLQMWFNLAWFGHEFRHGAVALITGEKVNVDRFVRQQHTFSHDDVLAMVEDQYKILRAVVPIHRALQESGRIEVSTTPAFHPILPLVIDTDRAYIDRPGTTHPTRFAHPEDAKAQIELASSDYRTRFGRAPTGMWPAEGAVSVDAVEMVRASNFSWLATDAGVLARSGRWGYRASEPSVLCQPYRASEGTHSVAVFFRDTDLSDGIGFRYGQYTDAQAAVQDFVSTIERRFLDQLDADEDHVLTIVLDGENAWGGYPDDGRPFLHALYGALSSDSWLKTVTPSEYLVGNPARGIEPHPVEHLARVYNLATGSWIDEPGSSPGVDLGTWIGEPEENTAWNLLGFARSAVASADEHAPGLARAMRSLLAAEGSDWFWWFGSDQESNNDAAFDEMFRAHLRDAYQALNLDVPDALDRFIVAHPIVWTFTHPVTTIRHDDQISIRTNCPGRLAYRIDDASERTDTFLAVGGVMAGARRFQVTLGPFPKSAQILSFRFVCEHPGCLRQSPCCLGTPQEITFAHTTRTPPDTSGTMRTTAKPTDR